MPKWLDNNHIVGEMTDEEFIAAVNQVMTARVEKERKEGRPGNYGNDGYIRVYEETHKHNGITYELAVLRYFAVNRLPNGCFELRNNHKPNALGKHVVVEGKDGNQPLSYDLREFLGLDEFLYHDTLHSGMEYWTLKEQWKYAEKLAWEDCEIDLKELFDRRVSELQKELDEAIRKLKQ